MGESRPEENRADQNQVQRRASVEAPHGPQPSRLPYAVCLLREIVINDQPLHETAS